MTLDAEKYMAKRVDDQIRWHDQTSSKNQKCYKRLQMVSLTCAALIPFLVGLVDDETSLQIVVGGLGVIIAVVGGANGLYQFQKNWMDYRITAESLRAEKYRFETQSPPYDGPSAFRDFVRTIESILNEQNVKWQANQQAAMKAAESENGADEEA